MSAGPTLSQVRTSVSRERKPIIAVGQFIHAHPELGFRERQAADRITAYLEGLGFAVERPYGTLDTAFRAVIRGKGRGPTVGVLAEYDALPEVGHVCGHNLITTAAISAAAGVAGTRASWPGQFEIIGTPAEEMHVGKSPMAAAGAFDHLDACFMTHPSVSSRRTGLSNALRAFKARFRGRAAHAAAAPQLGINALDAAILFFNTVHAMRQHLREDARIHGIITEGGTACNVIPETAAIEVGVRSQDEDYLETLRRQVVRACRSAAAAVGARVTIRWDGHWYRAFRLNDPLDDLLVECYGAAGIRLGRGEASEFRGSLDMGNVSQVVPAAHPFFNIVPRGAAAAGLHTREFAGLANEPASYRAAMKAGTGMALAAVRLLADRKALGLVKRAFRDS